MAPKATRIITTTKHDRFATPMMYCRKCWYILNGLSGRRCPECGRPFDPANRRSYRKKARRRWWLTALLRTALALIVLLAVGGGWLYRRYAVEQRTMVEITDLGGMYIAEPLGPAWLITWAQRHDLPLINTVVSVQFKPRVRNDVRALRGQSRSLRPRDYSSAHLPDTELDAGLVHLEKLRNLRELNLSGTRLSDAGMIHLARLHNLEVLDLSGTQVTNAGLAYLHELTRLEKLRLRSTRVTDVGLVSLKDLNHLRHLDLSFRPKVDVPMAQRLAHLMRLRDLRANEVRTTGTALTTLNRESELPQGSSFDIQPITDAGLVHLKDLAKLEELRLRGTQITDAELVYLKSLTNLRWLELSGTNVTGPGLRHIAALPNLVRLDLSATPLFSSRLYYLRDFAKLEVLNISNTSVTDEGLVYLKGLTNLRHLGLARTLVSDSGLVHLTGLSSLRTFNISDTQVTDRGIAHLNRALPNAIVEIN